MSAPGAPAHHRKRVEGEVQHGSEMLLRPAQQAGWQVQIWHVARQSCVDVTRGFNTRSGTVVASAESSREEGLEPRREHPRKGCDR